MASPTRRPGGRKESIFFTLFHRPPERLLDNVGFSIYRYVSQDGPFEKLGWVDSVGNSAMPRDYQFIDKTAQEGHVSENSLYFGGME